MAFVQRGSNIYGTDLYGKIGTEVAISSDGLTVASGININNGIVRIYSWNGSTWVQKGADLSGNATVHMLNSKIALSSDGTVVLIGNYNARSNMGCARVYAWNGTNWTQRGDLLTGNLSSPTSPENYGNSVAISSDGSAIAIGAPKNAYLGGSNPHGIVYNYTWNGTSWVNRGYIAGQGGDSLGTTVVLSSDGLTVLTSCPDYSTGYLQTFGKLNRYTWNGTSWIQGNSLMGSPTVVYKRVISISSDASILAVGNNNIVYTYYWNGTNYISFGGTINGENTGDYFGSSVSLSSDGIYLAVGAPYNKPDGISGRGSVRMYKRTDLLWNKLGDDIDGTVNNANFGISVALSGDGSIFVAGSPYDSTNGAQTGNMRTFKYQTMFAPDAPTSVSGTSGNGRATITFTPPANNGGATITSYTVTASPGGATASGASSPLTVTGLTNGTAYTFTVTATNSVGTGSASSASAPVTPAVAVSDLNSGNISKLTNETVIAGSRSITAKKLTKSAGAVSYAPDAVNKPSVAISNIPATVQDVTIGVASSDASGIAVVKIVAQDASNNLITDFSASPLTVRVTLPGFTVAMVTIQTSATLGGAVTDTITGYRVGTNLYEFTTTHLTYFSASAYVPCLVAGTRVLTAGGYKAVEELKAGDLIRTADNRIVPFRLFTTTISATSPETAPYTIPANTFGASPAKDLTVSPYHAIQSAPGVWQIPKYASRMFEGITQAPAGQPITYYHLELPNYFKDNLVVEGTVTESYGNKQTAGMKTVYKFNPGLNGFVRMEKTVSAKKSMH